MSYVSADAYKERASALKAKAQNAQKKVRTQAVHHSCQGVALAKCHATYDVCVPCTGTKED